MFTVFNPLLRAAVEAFKYSVVNPVIAYKKGPSISLGIPSTAHGVISLLLQPGIAQLT
jgi:hypothetical protein